MRSNDLLAHRVEGDGPPLLLLNGGLMTYAAWAPVASILREHYSLVLCDLRGQLLSPGPAPLDLAANVEDLEELLDHLEIPSTHVFGTSYGGEIALMMAALRPERVRSLIAVTVCDYTTDAMKRGAKDLRAILAGGADPEARVRFHERLVAEVYSEPFKERFGETLASRSTSMAALPATWFADLDHIIAATQALDLRPYLNAIRCPTLIVVAADDRVMPVERSLATAAAIPGAVVRTHETSGHALVAEDPAWLARIALDFLAEHPGAGDPGASPV